MHDLVAFSHLRWDSVYQRPQHLLSRLARDRRVFYVEEPESTTGPAGITASSPCAGVTVLRGQLPLDAAGFADAQLALLQPLLRQCLADHGVHEAVAWFYTPMALPLLDAVPACAVVYDCMDELPAFAFAPPQQLQRETVLLERADLVLTGGPSLFDAKKSRSANVHCFASSVDVAHFAPVGERVDDSPISKPRLGFLGVIDERLDIALITALAQAEPDWQIVMVGPVVRVAAMHAAVSRTSWDRTVDAMGSLIDAIADGEEAWAAKSTTPKRKITRPSAGRQLKSRSHQQTL